MVSAFSGRDSPLPFLLLEEELDDHATKSFFDHVEHLVLRIQSLVPPFFHVLPIVIHMSLNTLNFVNHHNFVIFSRFSHSLIEGILACLWCSRLRF